MKTASSPPARATSAKTAGNTWSRNCWIPDGPSPRDLIFKAMDEIKKIALAAPVEPGQVLMENLFGTGSDLITTSRVEKV